MSAREMELEAALADSRAAAERYRKDLEASAAENTRLRALVERRLRLTVPQATALMQAANAMLAGEEGEGDAAHVSFGVLERAVGVLRAIVAGLPASDTPAIPQPAPDVQAALADALKILRDVAIFLEEQMPLFGGVSTEFGGEGEPLELIERIRAAARKP